MEKFVSILVLLMVVSFSSADKTITCPSCTHVDSALVNDAFSNEACKAEDFDPKHPDIKTTACTASGTDVAKCVQFSGQISFMLPIAGLQTINTHIRSCTVETSDPGNICENVSGDQDSTGFIAQQISNILSVFSFFGGDDNFDGQFCYSDENTTSDAAHIHAGFMAILVNLSLMYMYVMVAQ